MQTQVHQIRNLIIQQHEILTTEVTLRLLSNVIGANEADFPHKLLLTLII